MPLLTIEHLSPMGAWSKAQLHPEIKIFNQFKNLFMGAFLI